MHRSLAQSSSRLDEIHEPSQLPHPSRTLRRAGDENRVQKLGVNPKLYFCGSSTDPMLETDLSGAASEEYIFFNGKRIARRDVNVTPQVVHYYYSDHLGSASVMTDASGNLSEQCDYYPYGGIAPSASCTGDPNSYKFNAKERDGESEKK